MALSFPDDQYSDEEVFFGKLSLKEVKKHILWSDHKRNNRHRNNCSNDLKIIETHSEPDLNKKESNNLGTYTDNTSLSPNTPLSYSNWDIKPANDSFLEVEKMVTDLCISHESKEPVNKLDNTLDIIDYILKNGPKENAKSPSHNSSEKVKQELVDNDSEKIKPEPEVTEQAKPLSPLVKTEVPQIPPHYTPAKFNLNTPKKTESTLVTPSTDQRQKEIFKTPKNPLSQKKPSTTSLKKTPCKSNAYQHIASPVASYIKNCPVTPLMKQVKPMKPLPGTSSIPKLVKVPPSVKSDCKENRNLPPVAYKSAKKTKVIDVPDEVMVPQTQWMKKVTSSLPKPVILKHDHREVNPAKRILGTRQEGSFADLSLHQADVSVCTQKSAFNKPKKPL